MSDTPKNDPAADNLDDDFLDDDILDDDLDALDDDDALLENDAFDEDGEWDDDLDALDDDAPPKPAEKSFLSKNFNTLIIGAAVLIGGVFIFNTVLKPATQPEPAQQADTPALDEKPIDLGLESLRDYNSVEEAVLPYIDEINALDTAAATQKQPDSSNNIDADDLDNLAPQDDFFADLAGITPPPAEAEADVEIMAEETPLLPLPTETTTPNASLTPLDDSLFNDNTAPLADTSQAGENVFDDMFAPLDANAPLSDIVMPDIAAPAIIKASPPPSGRTRIADLEKNLIMMSAEIEKLQTRNTMLEGSLASKGEATESLERTVQMLEMQLADAKAAAKASTKVAAAPVKAVIKKPVATPKSTSPAPAAQVTKPKPTKAVPVRAAKTPTWVMRSAHQGRAVLADAKTGDLLKISVGDTVPGLGRIQSIRFDTGRWIVQGTRNKVIR